MTMTDLPTLQLTDRMLDILDLDRDLAYAGNVAANAYRLAYAHPGDPFAGLHIGWGPDAACRAGVAMLVSVVSDLDDLIDPCEDCDGTGTVTDLPDDEPAYWSDIADGTYDSECLTCDGTGGTMPDTDDAWQAAYSAVPIYNSDIMAAVTELDPNGNIEVDPHGLGLDPAATVVDAARYALYGVAHNVAYAIVDTFDN